MKKPNIRSAKYSFTILTLLMTFGSNGLATALGTPANPSVGSSFDQRLAQRKQEQNEQLDAKAQQHIQQTCTKSQGGLRSVQTKAITAASNRNTAYQQIDATLLITVGQLKLASQDTLNLEQARSTYVQKISAFRVADTSYLQAIGDALTVNCQSDPIGFQALLDTVRAYNQQLVAQSSDISSFVSNTVQPAIQSFIGQLQQKSSDS